MLKLTTKKIIIQSAGKESVNAVMTAKDYRNMCYRNHSDTEIWNNLDYNNLSTTGQNRFTKFVEKYKSILKSNERGFLTKRCHKI